MTQKYQKWATRGCPQGSVLGLICWNLMFDELLRMLEVQVKDRFVAYADDLIILVSGIPEGDRIKIEAKSQVLVDQIVEWYKSAKLQISGQKTEAIFLRSEELRRAQVDRQRGARQDRRPKNRKRRVDFKSRLPTVR